MTSVVQETVSGIRLVKSFGGEAYEEARSPRRATATRAAVVRLTRLALLGAADHRDRRHADRGAHPLDRRAQVLVDGHDDGSRRCIAFLTLVLRMLQPLKQLSQMPTTAQASLAAAERLFEILDSPTEVADSTRERATARSFERDLGFEGVSFAYDDAPGAERH